MTRTKGTLLPFPSSPTRVLQQKVRREILASPTTGAMMNFIQQSLVRRLPKLNLGRVRLDIIFDSHQGLFVVYLYASHPSFPLVVKGPCERSCLVAVAEQLCSVQPVKDGEVPKLVGIVPPFIEPLPEFGRVRE